MATGTTDTETREQAGLELEPAEREILAEVATAFAATLREPAARQRYAELGEAARDGLVPTWLLPALETMLELVLQARRVRQQHGPEAEHTLSELFYRTERGAGLRRAAREVNRALETLHGQVIEKLTVMAGPGRYTLVIHTDRAQLTLKLDSNGAQVEKVEVGG